ncbi:hypothetical protein DVH24_017466 [Malus domestica]|uniref:Cytochrome b561 domain-containing protein n=1 Tax=Malus domestica TaxID=3750 RepID=A0A498IY66_MALDO|nr:hypothetical protein DVH24_017466 [Malus domestica]
MSDDSKTRGLSGDQQGQSQSQQQYYGTFQGVANYYPPPPQPPPEPVVGFPQPVPPPRSSGRPPLPPLPPLPPHHHHHHHHHHQHGYQTVTGYAVVEGRPVRERRLPCCGIGIGWLFGFPSSVVGQHQPVPSWLRFLSWRHPLVDYREKPGYVACTIAAILAVIAITLGVTNGAENLMRWPMPYTFLDFFLNENPERGLRDRSRVFSDSPTWFHQYQVVGRKLPTETDEQPKIYRMKLWATNEVRAKSKFWYFLRKLKKVKKSNGQVLAINEIFEKNPTTIKNYGIWLRYQSRTGYHNMYKEYRDTTLNGAVEQMYIEMASRHRVRFPCIQIIKTATIPAKLCKRESTKQFHNSKIKFPLVFRKVRPPSRKLKTTYKASRPNLFIMQTSLKLASFTISTYYLLLLLLPLVSCSLHADVNQHSSHENIKENIHKMSPRMTFNVTVHGLLSWFSMGFLMPLGILVLSVLLATAGAAMSLRNFENSFNNNHQRLGLALYAAIWIQTLIGFFRPRRGKKERSVWYLAHWMLGTVISLVGIINIYTGLEAYHKRTQRSSGLWTVLFTAEVSFIAAYYLFQDKRDYIQKQGVLLGTTRQQQQEDEEIAQRQHQNQKEMLPAQQPSGKVNALKNLFD